MANRKKAVSTSSYLKKCGFMNYEFDFMLSYGVMDCHLKKSETDLDA